MIQSTEIEYNNHAPIRNHPPSPNRFDPDARKGHPSFLSGKIHSGFAARKSEESRRSGSTGNHNKHI